MYNFLRKIIAYAIILFLCTLFTSNLVAQTRPDEVLINYSSINKPLSLVLREISAISDVRITFSDSKLPQNKKVRITARNEKVGDLLSVILKKYDFSYQIVGNQLVVVKDNERGGKAYRTINGYVRDKLSGENLVYANVYLFDKSKVTQTNEDGFFSLTVRRGVQRVYFSYIGYKQEVLEYLLDEDVFQIIELEPDVQLNEIIIFDEVESREEETSTSEDNLYLDQIRTSSTLGGESDILRLVNMMPGVSSGADGLGGMNIRGGSADQNLVLLDGAPLYNTGHSLGLFSVFNSDVVKSAKLIKGNIPARYGGRLSSVLDVHTRDGNAKSIHGGISVSTLAAKAFVEGPLLKNGSSYLVSGRRTFLDPWIKAATEYLNEQNNKEGYSTYFFEDFNAKINLKFNKNHSLLLSGFRGRDVFGSNTEEFRVVENINQRKKTGLEWNWGNNLLSLKLKSRLSKKMFSTLGAYYTDFSFVSLDYDSYLEYAATKDSSYVYNVSLFNSQVADINVNYNIDYIPNTLHRIRAGIGYTKHKFSPGLISVNEKSDLFMVNEAINKGKINNELSLPSISGTEINGYIEDDLQVSYSSKFNIGLHLNYTSTGEKNYVNVQPRISYLAQDERIFFKIGISGMNQYLHLISNNGLGFPTDVWLPSTDKIAPEKSWIFSSSLGLRNTKGYQLGAEGYFKIFDNITSTAEGKTLGISTTSDWEINIPIGKGTAYGVELYFNKIIGRTTWNANYTLGWSNRTFLDLNNGNEYPFRYNRTHNAKLGFFHKVTDNTEFVLNWTYASGDRVTFPEGLVVDVEGRAVPIYLKRNNEQLPYYHRLDVAFNFYGKLSWARQKISLGLYNVMNRKNRAYIDIVKSKEKLGAYEKASFSVLPIFPSISYSLYF